MSCPHWGLHQAQARCHHQALPRPGSHPRPPPLTGRTGHGTAAQCPATALAGPQLPGHTPVCTDTRKSANTRSQTRVHDSIWQLQGTDWLKRPHTCNVVFGVYSRQPHNHNWLLRSSLPCLFHQAPHSPSPWPHMHILAQPHKLDANAWGRTLRRWAADFPATASTSLTCHVSRHCRNSLRSRASSSTHSL
jgi:hypothetical protein